MVVERIDAATAAVVCVECQNGVLGAESVLPALATDSANLVTALARLLDGARRAGARVVHATYEGDLGGGPSGTARIWRTLARATANWTPHATAAAPLAELSRSDDVIIARHHGLYPSLDTELIPVLKGWGVRTVILTGVSLNLALPFTAGHLSEAGLTVVIPRDAVGATPREYGEQVLTHSLCHVARIDTVDGILAGWSPA